jgi:NAD(P)-dependent dehydrogenase (short-subunit alcohol dehydrogenase family)
LINPSGVRLIDKKLWVTDRNGGSSGGGRALPDRVMVKQEPKLQMQLSVKNERKSTMAGLVQGKIALVTGGGSGIGRATALALAKEGAKVAVSDIVVAGGEETVRMITTASGEATFIKTDVAKAAEVEALIKKVVEIYGRLDCAFNNAGIEGEMTTTVDCSEENFDRTIAVNLKGVWLCMKHEIPQMLKQGGGAIVNTASVAGLVGFQGASAYVASKHGVNGLTKTAALEYAKQGIRVNAVCPGVIHTPMLDRLFTSRPAAGETIAAMEPVGRLGKPEEIAAAVVWLCSDAASFVTGLPMAVDGGLIAQ